jgi:hypothetical protein
VPDQAYSTYLDIGESDRTTLELVKPGPAPKPKKK